MADEAKRIAKEAKKTAEEAEMAKHKMVKVAKMVKSAIKKEKEEDEEEAPYEQEMLSMVLADFRSELIAFEENVPYRNDSKFEFGFNALKRKAMLQIWLDAIVMKTAGFVPLQFPIDPDSNDVSPVSPEYIKAKCEEVFKKHSENFTEQMDWAKDAMENILMNSSLSRSLTDPELKSTNKVIQKIVNNLEEVKKGIVRLWYATVRQPGVEHPWLEGVNRKAQFWSQFKGFMNPFEKTWSEDAARQFDQIERVSEHCRVHHS